MSGTAASVNSLAVPKNTAHKMLTYGCTLSIGSSLLVHRDVFDEIGLFNPALRRHEDWDWAIRCTRRYEFVSVLTALCDGSAIRN